MSRLAPAEVDVPFATEIAQWARSPDLYALILTAIGRAAPAPNDLKNACTPPQIAEQLETYWRLDCFPKPVIALLDGTLTANEIGATAFSTHRVAGENYRFHLPSPTERSSLPLAGVAHALARLPEVLAIEVAAGRRALDRAEALSAGLVTHCISSSHFPSIIAALSDGQPVDPLLDALHQPPAPSPNREAVAGAPSATTDDFEQACQNLRKAARTMDVRQSLIATYRCALALRQAATATAAATDMAYFLSEKMHISTTDFADLALPVRSEIEIGRF